MVVCGIDGSESSRGVALAAVEAGQLLGRPVVFVRVVEPVPIPAGAPEGMREEVDAAEIERAAAELDQWLDEWSVHGERQVVLGSPAQELMSIASDGGAACIVVGSHARGLLSTVVLGSVAADVVRDAECPVLVIPRRVWRRALDA